MNMEEEKKENEPQPETPPEPSAGELLQAEIKKLREEVESLKDSRLRIVAEFDNYKKRTAREQIQLMSCANEAMVRDLIPVLENFERALHPDHKEKEGAVLRGIELIYAQLNELLKKAGIQEHNPVGQDFNPEQHEAILYEESKDTAQNKISKVFQKGYSLNSKMIQFAKVAVSKGNSK